MTELALQILAAQKHIGTGRFVLGVAIAAAGIVVLCVALPRKNGEGDLRGIVGGFAIACLGCLISFYHNK